MGSSQTEPNQSAVAAVPPPSPRRLTRYLLILFLIPLLFYPLPFPIATSASYEHWSTSQWGPMLEFAYDTHRRDADVVIFGDSSAFIGIDPKLLNTTLGVRSLLLPDTIGSIPVTGDAPLKTYLAHNRPPRLLVLYFSAWNLDFDRIAQVRQFEGQEMMLRHQRWPEITRFALRHPLEMLRFPFRLYSTFGPKMLLAARHHVNREQATADSLGHANFTDANFGPLAPNCTFPPSLLAQTGTSSVEELVHRYSTPQTRVMVYLAPIPNCRNSAVMANRSFAGLGAAPPKILPAPFFVGDAFYAHTMPAAVPAVTTSFAEALARQLQAP